jgi:hypothetical protein
MLNSSKRASAVGRRRPLSRFWERVMGAALFRRRPLDPRLLAALRDEAAALAGQGLGTAVSAEPLWDAKRGQLLRLLQEGDPAEFLRWEPVRTTMVKRGRVPVAHELRHLRRRPDWSSRWRPALRETTLGRPRPFHRWPWSSGTLIHHAYHLCRFEEATGLRLPALPLVVEFGGGYGSMCRLFHQLGFAGTYVIFDLPEVSILQRFFLDHLGIPRLEPGGSAARGVITTADPRTLAAQARRRPPGGAAFVATWSLGEAPLALRERVLESVADFDAFLFGYTEQFLDVDNRRFFARWRARLPGHIWHELPLPHLRKAEWYLFGAR